ncbi:MAG: hypothetical protein JWM10_245 [Myxococcaceae bacterium]|nr:hypothetical protein [Myxococcaceae bacterium]
MSAALHPGAAELASDCEGNNCAAAAAIVRAGLTDHAAAVTADLSAKARHRDTREVWQAQVAAWAAGHLDLIAASNAAWRRAGCSGCALAALRAGEEAAVCAGCAERAGEA